MALTGLPIPPTGVIMVDPRTGAIDTQWQNYFLELTNALTAISGVLAPVNAQYWLSHANAILTSATNLGALSTGYVKIAVASSTATPSSVFPIPLTDVATLAASTYTPTLTAVANVAASTAFACQWMQVGATVTVSGKLSIDPTAGATLTQLGISLPVASNFSAEEQCGGTAATAAVSGYSAAILADATNDRAELDFTTTVDVANRDWYFVFCYRVI